MEDIVDAELKRHIVEDLHPILQKKFGGWLSSMVEAGLVKLIDVQLVPHTSQLALTSPVQEADEMKQDIPV